MSSDRRPAAARRSRRTRRAATRGTSSFPRWAPEGQAKLKAARVLAVGAGGLGSPLALYLAAAGVGTIGLVDSDAVDASNLQRQVLYGTARRRPAEGRRRRGAPRRGEPERARRADRRSACARPTRWRSCADYDVVVDGTDNFPDALPRQRRVRARRASRTSGRPCTASRARRPSSGRRRGPATAACIPSRPPEGSVPSCAEGGVLGVLPGPPRRRSRRSRRSSSLLGIGTPLVGRLLLVDALAIAVPRDAAARRTRSARSAATWPTITALRVDGRRRRCETPGRPGGIVRGDVRRAASSGDLRRGPEGPARPGRRRSCSSTSASRTSTRSAIFPTR